MAKRRRTASTPPDHDARKRELAGVALSIVDAEGLPRLTMRRLAQQVGMTPMSLYWYFDDKQGVLDAVAELVDEEIVAERPQQALGDMPTAAEWLGELLARAVRVLTRHHPDITTLIESQLSAPTSAHLTEHALGNLERTVGYLADAGITGVEAAQVSFLVSQSPFMLARACRRDPDESLSPDARLRAQWESLRDVSTTRYPHLADVAASFEREPSAPTLLQRGLALFTAAVADG